MSNSYIVEMRHITKKFPGVIALDNAYLKIECGTIHGLVGENGAGKSTLVKILSGVYPYTTYEGEVIVNGKVVQLKSVSDALLKGIGMVPQEIMVIDELSVAENIVVGLWNGTGHSSIINMRKVKTFIQKFLDDYEIELDPNIIAGRLTVSQKQLLMIARVLYRNPSILVLDEPTSSLTLNEIDKLFNRLRMLKSKGVTCLLITHKLAEILELTDRVTVLRDGKVSGEFEKQNYNEDDIIQAMIGRKLGNLYPVRKVPISNQECLRVENLTVPHPKIADLNVVENVSFYLRKGEILGLAGLVGSGRSEVVNAIIGRMPHTGRIFVDGKEVIIKNPADAIAAGIVLVTEDRAKEGLLFNMSIRPNITLYSLKLFTNGVFLKLEQEKKLAAEAIKRFNIMASSIEQMVSNLSGGNQQKVVISRVLMSNPKIILLDEPTKGIDIGAKHEIYELMYKLTEQGTSIIVISSELPELLSICDRFIVLAEGRVTDEFDRSEASDYRVMKAATKARFEFAK